MRLNYLLTSLLPPCLRFLIMHKFKLIDLGRPQDPQMASAFIHLANGENHLIKGGWYDAHDMLSKSRLKFIGKLRLYSIVTKKLVAIYAISSKDIEIRRCRIKSHMYFEFYDAFYNILLKRVRRFPNQWIQELLVDVESQLMASSDFLMERGLEASALFIKSEIEKVRSPARFRLGPLLQQRRLQS